jgi:hypothetical protein
MAMDTMILAHLLGEKWHLADLLLYGGAGIGFMGGAGLFLWGRRERQAPLHPQPPEADQLRQAPLIKRG